MSPGRVRAFLAELHRRRVFASAAVYVLAAWLVTEAAAALFPLIMLPDWSVGLLRVLAVGGLPVALVLAWRYDFHPVVTLTPPVQADEPTLTPERWRRIQALFHEARRLGPGERERFLARACGEDEALRRDVDGLIEGEEALPPVLGLAPRDLASLVEAPARERGRSREGERIGPYLLVRRIGEGGMGEVYLAQRTDVGKRVAIKLVHGGPGAMERFLFERRVLARLEHPNIAALHDAGVAEDGTPYFAMQYVEGGPFTDYCEEHRLPLEDRLVLFGQACEAVAYAHRQGIVHRDLKPSNLLVTGARRVILLDFGIAKALEPVDEVAPLTGPADRFLTPGYAAPEQVSGGPITPATDVYVLGVLLFELLTGTRPRPGSVRPSAALTAGAAGRQRASLPELETALRRGLDDVCARALEPDPERRYASAGDLLAALREERAAAPHA